MEFLNRIEIIGLVGSKRTTGVGDTSVTHFSVAVEYGHEDKDGTRTIETQWFNVMAWDNEGTADAKLLKKGDCVSISGRLRTYRFTDADGNARNGHEIVARTVSLLPEETGKMKPQHD